MSKEMSEQIRWSIIRSLPAALAAGLGTVVLIGENVEKLTGGRSLLFLFIVGDVLRWEIAAFLILFLIRRPLGRVFKRFGSSIIYFLRRAKREPRYWLRALSAVTVTALLIATATYHLSRYAYGKAIFLKNYSSTLSRRAHDAYAAGKGERAALYLRAGAQLYKHDEFDPVLAELEARLERASRLREVLNTLPVSSPHRRELIHAIAALDHKTAMESQLIAEHAAIFRDLDATYSKGVEALRQNNLDSAQRSFDEVHRTYPSFGDVHMIRRELTAARRNRNEIDSEAFPYLRALRRGGPQIIEALTKPVLETEIEKNEDPVVPTF